VLGRRDGSRCRVQSTDINCDIGVIGDHSGQFIIGTLVEDKMNIKSFYTRLYLRY